MLDIREVDADLVCPARFRSELQERKTTERFEDLVKGNGLFAALRPDRVFLSDFGMDAQRDFDTIVADRVRYTAIEFWRKLGFEDKNNGNYVWRKKESTFN